MNRNKTSELADKARQGDRAAFEALYKAYSKKIYYFALQNTGSEAAAEDVTSETFADAMESIGSLRSGEAFSGWLFAISYKKCADHLGSTSRSTSIDSEELLSADAQGDTVMLPYDYAESRETVAKLKEIIDTLSPDQRSAVIMYYYDEMSVSEVAEAMGTNKNNVSQKLHRARKRIRRQIEKLIGKGAMFGAVPMGRMIGDLDLGTKGIAAGAAAAIAAGIPYGLSKASGGSARELLWITRKYWAKHKKSLAALLFSGVLLCAVVCCIFLMTKQSWIRGIEDRYDLHGSFTLMLPDAYPEAIETFTKEDTLRGEVSVYGKAGLGNRQFHIGSLDDPEGLAHFDLEEGRMPEAQGEIAAFRSVLVSLGFFGSVGEKLTLDKGTYTLVGVIRDGENECRENTDLFFEQVYGADVYSGGITEETFPYCFPMLFTVPETDAKPDYTWVMLDSIAHQIEPDKDFVRRVNDDFNDGVGDILQEYGLYDREGLFVYFPKTDYAVGDYNGSFRQDMKRTFPIYLSACIIAALSVLAVMRNIFAEREDTVRMLRRIGVSKRRIRVMYAIEFLCLAMIQTVIGFALGTAAHLGISAYQINVLDMKSVTGFTSERYADWLLPDPFLTAGCISVGVLLAGYLLAGLLSLAKARERKKRKAAALWRCVGRAFRTRAVTVIQTLALTLICFSTVYGYMLFHHTEGSFDHETGEFHPIISTKFGREDQFDFDEDKVEEYYYTTGRQICGINSFTFAIGSDHFNGIEDADAEKLGDVICHGELPYTFITADKNSGLGGELLCTETERQFIADSSSDEGKALFRSGKSIFFSPLQLGSSRVIDRLSEYVTAGTADIGRLDCGEEVILIVRGGESPMRQGESITLGAAETENGFGIGALTLKETRIGAVVTLPKELDRIIEYSASAKGRDCCLLTTAKGAEAMGFKGARYTELFARQSIGSDLPLGTGFTLESYSRRRKELFLQNAGFLGSMGALILLMSLLGFAAYFNGIGLKIRLKEYQISIMRAVGSPIKRLRRRLTLDSIRIPLRAGAAAYVMIKAVQKIMLGAYNRTVELDEKSKEVFAALCDASTDSERDRLSWECNEIQQQGIDLGRKYMTDLELWFMNAVIPTLTIFAVMCFVTVLLTRRSFRMFTPDIAGALARGRKRR